MTNQHPITPPLELVNKWVAMLEYCEDIDVFTDVVRWGADQELEACCEWFLKDGWNPEHPTNLRAVRRPKPQSLKERAMSEVASAMARGNITPERGAIIRLALEQLDD